MRWEQLLSAKRQRESESTKTAGKARGADLRSEFEKDYHRIIGSASFRRLQDKTQVFPLDKSDFIRTRLTHSLEVSSFCKSLGQNIGQNILEYDRDPAFTVGMKEDVCNILQCAGLIHDIGNPPFGHFGETAIRNWFQEHLPLLTYQGRSIESWLSPQMRSDFYNFEGNAQALRLVTKLHYLIDEHGMNLTYALLNTIIKYPVSSLMINKKSGNIKDKKAGYYYADRDIFADVRDAVGIRDARYPLTYILEAADDIAYATADVEDAVIKGFLSFQQLREELKGLSEDFAENAAHPLAALDKLYERGLEKHVLKPEVYAVKNWIVKMQGFLIYCATLGFTSNYEEIMEGSYCSDLFQGTAGKGLITLMGDVAYRRVFVSRTIYKLEVMEGTILSSLLDKFVKAAIQYDSGVPLSSMELRLMSFVSDNYKSAYHCHSKDKTEGEKLYLRLLLVTDYICGMTDSYAKCLYQELNGIV